MSPNRYQVLCILSDVRSGSTLVGQLLGAHSKIVSVGELQWLRAYALNDRRLYNPPHEMLCACGETFADCSFWQAVAARISEPLSDLHFKPELFEWSGPGARRQALHRRIPRRIVERYPDLYRSRIVQQIFGGARVATNNMEVFDAIFEQTNARYFVDMSKNIFRFRSIYDGYGSSLKIVILHRDYRAVTHSKMKRGVSLEEAAGKWANKVYEIRALTAGIPAENIVQMKYEDLCTDPKSELLRLCNYLNLEFEESMMSRPTEGIHDLGGSPSKLEPERKEIRLDTAYQQAFSDGQLEQIRRIVGSAADICGYD
ncbi:MAG: sulfotransferase [Woeseiaceae bacterium]